VIRLAVDMDAALPGGAGARAGVHRYATGGVAPSPLPLSTGVYSSLYFTITGIHLLYVGGGTAGPRGRDEMPVDHGDGSRGVTPGIECPDVVIRSPGAVDTGEPRRGAGSLLLGAAAPAPERARTRPGMWIGADLIHLTTRGPCWWHGSIPTSTPRGWSAVRPGLQSSARALTQAASGLHVLGKRGRGGTR
jgi:hypothetical protein